LNFWSCLELDDEIEIQDNWPKQLQDTINARLKTDLIFCPIIGLIVFVIHSSNIFLALQPELNPVSKYFYLDVQYLKN